METTYTVSGMTCGGCARSVEGVARSAAPNAKIEISLEEGKLRVIGEHDGEALTQAVEDAGFDCAPAS